MNLIKYFALVVVAIGFTGTCALSNKAFSLRKAPDKGRSLSSLKGRTTYRLEAEQEVVNELVQDLVNTKFMDDVTLRKSLEEYKKELLDSEDADSFGKLRRKNKHRTTTESPESDQDDSLLDRGLKYLRGLLLGDDDSSSGNDNSGDSGDATPSPEDESILDDIEKYLEGVSDAKNGTLHKILNYIVSYVHRNVHFWLFKRDQTGYEVLSMGRAANVSRSEFDSSKKTYIFVHGWINAGDNNYAQFMIDGFDKFGDFNLISVDWSDFSYRFYSISRLAVNFVGPYVAKMVDFLSKHHDVKLPELHILGHSLGAHIAGIAGLFAKSGKIGRITGFDPARPLFGDDNKYRLDASDARFVDVIHSSFLGMPDALGHIDFYPNGGGPSQPGCGIDLVVCPHRRSYRYFLESLSNNNFLAYACDSWDSFTAGNCTTHYTHMGMFVSRRRRGKFYLRTADASPFAIGNKTLDPPPEDDVMLKSKSKRPLRHKAHVELY